MSKFIFKKRRAKKLLALLYEAYQAQTHLFQYIHCNNNSAPQHKHIPVKVKKGSRDHQIFLFFSSILTYHSQSEMGFRQSLDLYEKHPEIFNKEIENVPVEKIQTALKKVGFIYPNSAGSRWKGCGETLFKIYKGDPLLVFKNKTINGIVKEMKSKKNLLPGLGPKLLSMLNLFYVELELMAWVNDAFPCDVHIQNQCLSLGLVKAKNQIINTENLANFLRINISKICQEEKMNALDLSYALWFLGNSLCTNCNRQKRISEVFCPLFKYCSGRLNTELYREKGKWDLNEEASPLPLFQKHQPAS